MSTSTSHTPSSSYDTLLPDERGATTIGTAFIASVLCIVLIVGMTIAGIVHTKHQLHNATDAAALAAAGHLPHDSDHACTHAATYLAQTGYAELSSCEVKEHPRTRMPAVWVEATTHFARWDMSAHSCAGPIPPR